MIPGPLGIETPIVQAPIGSATTPELAAAVSNAGGLGTLAVTWREPAEIRRLLRRTRALTPRPFAANLVLAWAPEEKAGICVDEGAPILSTFWGDPAPCAAIARRAGIPLVHAVGSVEEARAAADAGVDALVAQGVEAGGHVRGTLPRDALLAAVIDAVAPLPVLAAGGIVDAADVRSVLDRGAAGAWVGTRFVCSRESGVDAVYRDAIVAAGEGDTTLGVVFDGGWEAAPHRVLRNSTVRAWERAGSRPAGARPGEGDVVARSPDGTPVARYADVIPVAGSSGDLEALALYAGTGSARIRDVAPAAEIVRALAAGCGPSHRRGGLGHHS